MKIVITVMMLAVLVGCAGIGGGSGYYNKKPVLDSSGNLIVDPLTRRPLWEITKESNAVAIAREGSDAISSAPKIAVEAENNAPSLDCLMGYSASDVAALTEEGERSYFDAVSSCNSDIQTQRLITGVANASAKTVAVALDRPVTEGAAIAREFKGSTIALEQGKTQRSSARWSAVKAGFFGFFGWRTASDIASELAAVGIAAGVNAGTSIGGDVNISPGGSSTGGLASNDPTAGGENSPGTAEGDGGSASSGDTIVAIGGSASNAGGNSLISDNGSVTGLADGSSSAVVTSDSENKGAFGDDLQGADIFFDDRDAALNNQPEATNSGQEPNVSASAGIPGL